MKNDKRGVTLLLLILLLLPVGAQQSRTLTLLQTSDTHSRIEPIDAQAADASAGMGGFVRRITLLGQLKKETPGLLLFDCGDFSQGTPYYNLFRGEVEVKMMNRMGYDAVAIGNHEFDFGVENMARIFRMAEFPIVCANYEVKGTLLEGLVKPYVIVKRAGLKVGIFGLSPALEGLVQASKCEGVFYKDPVATANEVAARLKKEEKCDVVVCLSHLGVESDKAELIPLTRNIDVVLGGHSHTFMTATEELPDLDGKSVSLLHSGKNGIYTGKVEITFK